MNAKAVLDESHSMELQLQAAKLTGEVDLAVKLLRDRRWCHECFVPLREHARGSVAMCAL